MQHHGCWKHKSAESENLNSRTNHSLALSNPLGQCPRPSKGRSSVRGLSVAPVTGLEWARRRTCAKPFGGERRGASYFSKIKEKGCAWSFQSFFTYWEMVLLHSQLKDRGQGSGGMNTW
jgi:hypothetical protein